MSENIKVYVRVRPFLAGEGGASCVACSERQISVGGIGKSFAFDGVFDSASSEDDVFARVGVPAVEATLGGYNASVIAYGQTGSGKTYTMSSLTSDVVLELFSRLADDSQPPSASRKVAADGTLPPPAPPAKYTIRVSALEVYNENIGDLLGRAGAGAGTGAEGAGGAASPTSPAAAAARERRLSVSSAYFQASTTALHIREDPKGGVHVPGLTEVPVATAEELMALVEAATEGRRTASTLMNATSSRSHCVVTVTLQRKGAVARCCFVDLAGSERLKKSLGIGSSDSAALASSIGQMNGGAGGKEAVQERMREGISINGGLLALGNVIVALCERRPHVPYRSSKLTRLLQPMLGGNSKTTIVACVSPHALSLEETLNTLKYADRAKAIKTTPTVVVSTFTSQEEAEQTIQALRAELEAVQQQLATAQQQQQQQQPRAPAPQVASPKRAKAGPSPAPAGLPPPHPSTNTAGGSAGGGSSALQEEVAALRARLAEEQRLTAQLQEDLFNAEYTIMVEVERRKHLEEQLATGDDASEERGSSVETGGGSSASHSPRQPQQPQQQSLSSVLRLLEEERADLEALKAKKLSEAQRLQHELDDGGGDTDGEGEGDGEAITELSEDIVVKTRTIELLERQNAETRTRLQDYDARLSAIGEDKARLESELARAEQLLEASEMARQQKEDERVKLNAEYAERVRRAEETAADFRKRVREAEHEIRTRQHSIERTRQLQAEVERLREDLVRQRQANREEQRRVRSLSAAHMQETSDLQRRLRESELQVGKLHSLLDRKSIEIAKARNQLTYLTNGGGAGGGGGGGGGARRSGGGGGAAAADTTQAQIDREVQTLSGLEREIKELRTYRGRLEAARDRDGPRCERAVKSFTQRLQQIEQQLQAAGDADGGEAAELRREQDAIATKLAQLEPVQQKLSELDAQIDDFGSRIDTLNDVRKYHLNTIRRLQKGGRSGGGGGDDSPLPSVRDIPPRRRRRTTAARKASTYGSRRSGSISGSANATADTSTASPKDKAEL